MQFRTDSMVPVIWTLSPNSIDILRYTAFRVEKDTFPLKKPEQKAEIVEIKKNMLDSGQSGRKREELNENNIERK